MAETLHLARMLEGQKKHLSFHTPGHKRAGADITELSYSDNLYAPRGAIAAAEKDIAAILGADRSFILTDGSTCGVFSMLYALRAAGGKSVALPVYSHPSAFHAAEVLGLVPVLVPQKSERGIPQQPDETALAAALAEADALFLTSPDYYGFFPPLAAAKESCERAGKPLLIDGAHGGHLHFCESYAGRFADLWTDGVHKSLPALTQGAAVSGKGRFADLLKDAVRRFRTTSPSYPIMASVEYAVKYPRNPALEGAAEAFKKQYGCVGNPDWTKLLVPFGSRCDEAQAALEKAGIYAEFNDGNYLLFYLSPANREKDLKRLGRALAKLPRGEVAPDAPVGGIPIYSEGI